MKKIAVLLADGFEEVEALTVVDYLRRAGIHVDMVSVVEDRDYCVGSHDIKINVDRDISKLSCEDSYDGYFIPGGLPNAQYQRNSDTVKHIIREADKKGKMIASICAGPTVLYDSGILEGRKITSYPGVFKDDEKGFIYLEDKVVMDDNLITSRGPAITVHLALSIIEYLEGKEKRSEIEKQILFNMM